MLANVMDIFAARAQVSTKLRDALLESLPSQRVVKLAVLNATDIKFRMSGLPRLCPRMYGLMALEPSDVVEELDAQSVYTLGTGTALHHQFQTEYLAKLGKVYQGWWRCQECLETVRGEPMPAGSMLSHRWIPKPECCPKCERKVVVKDDRQPDSGDVTDFEAIELEFWNGEFEISGHCDGILDWNHYEPSPENLVEALEIKSIHPRGFPYVDPIQGGQVKPDHTEQCQGYLWGLEGTEIEQSRVFYVSKNFQDPFSQTLCEHVVLRDVGRIGQIQARLRKSRSGLADIDQWKAAGGKDSGSEPPISERLPQCTKKSDSRTKYCPMRDQCFPKKVAKKKIAKKKAAKKKVAKKKTAAKATA